MGVPVEAIHFTNELKKQMIEKLSNWISLKSCYLLKLEETINEFNQFTYDFSEKSGRIIYGAPIGFHDDIVISHALAIWGLNPIIRSTPVPELSIIAQDLHDKKQTLQNNQEGYDGYEEYEDV